MRQTVLRRRLSYPNEVFSSTESRRAQHQWLPRRLVLVRHGESAANVNREVYSTTPDWKIPLTALGREQAYDCGRRLRNIIRDEKLYIYYSPYTRTRQTLSEIRRSFDESQIQGEREDERLREQEMGNYQPLHEMDATWAARNAFGRLYYRFPFGESGADVGDRVSGFFDSLLRERIGLAVPNMSEHLLPGAREELGYPDIGRWNADSDVHPDSARDSHTSLSEKGTTVSSAEGCSSSPSSSYQQATTSPTGPRRAMRCTTPSHYPLSLSNMGDAEAPGILPPDDHGAGEEQNVLIIAHGLLIRLFIGRWFRVPMEVFETMCNPPNCAIILLERDDKLGRLVMTDISKSLFGSDPLLQMMRFDGHEDTRWYREKFLGIVDPAKATEGAVAEDDDENHYSMSNAHNSGVGAPAPPPRRRRLPFSMATWSTTPTSVSASRTSASLAERAEGLASTPGAAESVPPNRASEPASSPHCMDCAPNEEYMKFRPGSDDAARRKSVE
ncbi:hypothetical protein JKF63_02240 [Porcisia hertigi]|uniref:Glycerolphosphate mutase n=1 Tax=Porcisia hertigi TaxID=2761500 RepID=A0A836L5C3_9TRYP|nr:hypothetical protein JKF63_02240 [Porcisia hertigi]